MPSLKMEKQKKWLIWSWNPRLQNGEKDDFENYDLQGNLQTPRPIGSQVRHEWKGTLPGIDGSKVGLIITLLGPA